MESQISPSSFMVLTIASVRFLRGSGSHGRGQYGGQIRYAASRPNVAKLGTLMVIPVVVQMHRRAEVLACRAGGVRVDELVHHTLEGKQATDVAECNKTTVPSLGVTSMNRLSDIHFLSMVSFR
eukprot:TRINITY_DN107768_c0_g1_i1.p1 TRINITY_DN107768_c0_g1~~TRINITY_DN107768_c0_g1_i1.p1  ORF type:complete len:124 (+),score=10.69 TRINITY_DN107768_c0_g1_i1:132-503(+)